MKTEDLKAQGLSDEQINFVMAENGKDLKTLQDENAALKTEKSQLENDKKDHLGLNYKVSKQKKFKLFPGQLRLS